MEKLDVETLLDLNPQVDRKAIKLRQQKAAKGGSRAKVTGGSGGSASPYGGRRALPADKPAATRFIRHSR